MRYSVLFPPMLAVGLVVGSAQTATAQAGESASMVEEQARTMLADVVGTWRFALVARDNPNGGYHTTGRRVVEPTSNPLQLVWSEEFDGSSRQGRGFLGYDPRSRRYYYMALYSDGEGVVALVGTPVREGLVRFAPPIAAPPLNPPGVFADAQLQVVDRDHHSWLDDGGRWRVEFARETEGG